MKYSTLLAGLVLATGLTVPTFTAAAQTDDEPERKFHLDVPLDPIVQSSEAAATVAGWTTHPTSGRLQTKVGNGAWTDFGATLSIPITDDYYGDGDEFDLSLPTDTVGKFKVRFLLDSGPDFPEEEVADYVQTVTVVQTPPTSTHDTTLSMSALTEHRPDFGERITLTGMASGGVPRPIDVLLDTPGGWSPIASTTSRSDGSYAVAVPTDWYYSGKIRTATPKVRVGDTLYTAATSTTTDKVQVSVPYKPVGKSSDWAAASGEGQHVESRWDPCQAITYKVNTKGAPKGALAMTKQALRIVTAATGLRFDYRGKTKTIPYRGRGPYFGISSANLVIAWASPRQVPGLEGWTIGLGGHSSNGGEASDGGVVLDRTWKGKRGFKRGATWGNVLMHELGHAMGLAHAKGREQVMYPSTHTGSTGRYQAGDLSGLAMVGASQGCFKEPRYAVRVPVESRSTFVME